MAARTTKTDALIRDIAKLFVTYPPAVWRPVLDGLREAGGTYGQVALQLDELLDKASAATSTGRKSGKKPTRRASPSSRTKPKDPADAPPSQMSLQFSHDRRDLLVELAAALHDRRLLPTAADLRHVYMASGGKGALPTVRKAAILHLLHHLDAVPAATFSTIHEVVRRGGPEDTAGDYQRWFELIRKP